MRPTHERVLEALAYDPETGVFTWLQRTSTKVHIGDEAGGLTSDGYRRIKLDGGWIKSHILAWFYVTGRWPTYEIDHINGLPLDNRFANLRDEPHSVNMRNMVAPNRNSTTGFRGVSPSNGRWLARIKVHGRQHHLGVFSTPEEAHAAYLRAKAEHHGIETYQGRTD